MWAASAGLTLCARLLIDAGADTEAVDNDGHTALDLAQLFRHAEIASLLMKSRTTAATLA